MGKTLKNTQIELDGLTIEVVWKKIKNLHLRVYPPDGRVRISAPAQISLASIRTFALSRLDWIRKQQKKFQEQEREMPLAYRDGESHALWGRRCPLRIVEAAGPPSVIVEGDVIVLRVGPGTGANKKQAVIEEWYREQVRAAAGELVAIWEPVMGVKVERLFVQRMKTRWGTCTPTRHSIRLNSELAKKPRECLEYVVVHELAHLIEPTHNARFKAQLDRFLPGWQQVKKNLNRMPLAQV